MHTYLWSMLEMEVSVSSVDDRGGPFFLIRADKPKSVSLASAEVTLVPVARGGGGGGVGSRGGGSSLVAARGWAEGGGTHQCLWL